MKTREYKVTWEIEVSADSYKEAAKQALDCIINGDSKVFDVTNIERNNTIQIDLENE